MISKSRNVRRYLKARYVQTLLRNQLDLATAAQIEAQDRLTGSQQSEADRLWQELDLYARAVRGEKNPFKKKETVERVKDVFTSADYSEYYTRLADGAGQEGDA